MKKFIYFFAGAFLLCLSSNGSAQYFEEGGIAYNVLSATEHTVEVAPLECTYYRGRINIPSTVVHNQVTYDVVALGDEAFAKTTALIFSCNKEEHGISKDNIVGEQAMKGQTKRAYRPCTPPFKI